MTEIQYARIRTDGTATIVSGVSGTKVKVIGFALTCAANAFVSIQSSGTATATMGVYRLGGSITSVVAPNSRDGHFQTATGAGLVVETGSGTCAGHLVYQQSAAT